MLGNKHVSVEVDGRPACVCKMMAVTVLIELPFFSQETIFGFNKAAYSTVMGDNGTMYKKYIFFNVYMYLVVFVVYYMWYYGT
jgi:hypothetical protein